MSSPAYEKLVKWQFDASLLSSVREMLDWDQQTVMPRGGADHRARQSALLAGMAHEKATDDQIGRWLDECAGNGFNPDSVESANLREWRRDYDRLRKLPRKHVEELSHARSVANESWKKARAASEFPIFAADLKRVLDLTRKTAEYYTWPDLGEPYDALLDYYEPGATAAQVQAIFEPLRPRLSGLIKEIAQAPKRPDDDFHKREIPKSQQIAFVRFVASAIGFRFDDGNLHEAAHPFCSGMGPGDCRLTTRYRADFVMDALSSTMHEVGHGIYEQNLRDSAWGTPCGEAVSLGIHESQSRGWENFVGRSRAFWEWCLPHAQRLLPDATKDQTVDSIYQAQNIIKPSYIRVESDEATYNLHIMLRFEIERELLNGTLEVDDIPDRWNSAFEDYLGIKVDKDANGCLQDVHWSHGLVGYFPTYTLGNLYAAQFFEAAREQLGDLDAMYRKGEFEPLRVWLTENIHEHGRRYSATELCQRITGQPLSPEPLMRHLEGKLRPIYGI